MTEHVSLGLLVALGILVNLYGLIIVRDVHRITNETLLTTRTTLDAAIKILQLLFFKLQRGRQASKYLDWCCGVQPLLR